MEKIRITLHNFDNKFIIKTGNIYQKIEYTTYADARQKVLDIINKYGNDYEFLDIPLRK